MAGRGKIRSKYESVYRQSLEDPGGFWGSCAGNVAWDKAWDKVLDASGDPFFRWFPGGVLNTCHNCLDIHVEQGRGSATALIYDSPVTGTTRAYTYRELRDLVARFAGGLSRLGVKKGDRVVIYMPMVPETVIGMLACARIGPDLPFTESSASMYGPMSQGQTVPWW